MHLRHHFLEEWREYIHHRSICRQNSQGVVVYSPDAVAPVKWACEVGCPGGTL